MNPASHTPNPAPNPAITPATGPAVDPGLAERLIRFQHPEKVLRYLGPLDESRIAALFGLDPDTYLRLRRELAEQARRAAEELLDEPAFGRQVDRLPFRPGQRVVAIGESTTDDLLSWFEILRQLLALRRPADDITLVNMAVSGHTSTQALTLLPELAHHRPDWTLCMLGGNDAQRLGTAEGPTLVSAGETERGLRTLRDLAGRRTRAHWIWLTPSPVDEARVPAYPPFLKAGLSWANRDIDVIGGFLVARPETTLDTGAALAGDATGRFHLDDGLHLSLAGQQALARALVGQLS